jgi:hypothetical protein
VVAELSTAVRAAMGMAACDPPAAAWHMAVGPVGVSRHDRFLRLHYSTNVLFSQVPCDMPRATQKECEGGCNMVGDYKRSQVLACGKAVR